MTQNAVFQALAHKGRRMILDRLHESDGLTLSELCEKMPMTRQAVSKHLWILEQANLVGIIWRGREKLHYLNSAPIQEIYARWMRKYQAHYGSELEKLKIKLESKRKEK
jgi:DNA-binding transcriptional ArsR family regulator